MASKQRKTMVVDAGNGNIKVAVGSETEIIPSVFSRNDGSYIRGGFRLNDEDYIVGWDNFGRPDAQYIIDKDNGKLEFLHVLLGGAISAMRHELNPKDKLDLYVMTLNSDKRASISESVEKLKTGLVIDGQEFALDISLKNIYPEGYGASLYAANYFPMNRKVAVLDIGNGTLNISQYHQVNGAPRREMFHYVPAGVGEIVRQVSALYVNETTNGRVDDALIRDAMLDGTYLYMSDYAGRDISATVDKGIGIWLEMPKVKTVLVKAVSLLRTGTPVVAVGGGFAISKIRDRVSEVLVANANIELFHVPDDPTTLGVSGLANVVNSAVTTTKEMAAS